MARSGFVKIDNKVREHFDNCYYTAALFARLLFWFSIKEFFYKFKLPCQHSKCKKGDTWGEELGAGRKPLDKALGKLVTRYTTKRAYELATDKFKGRMFCSYTQKNEYLTYYLVNWQAVHSFLSSIGAYIPPFIEKHFANLPTISQEVYTSSEASFSMSKETIGSVPEELSLTRAVGIKNTYLNTHTTTTLDPDVPKVDDPSPTSDEVKLSREMKEIWNTKMPHKVTWVPKIAERLPTVLKERFNSSLDAFKQYVDLAATSDFLTGNATNSRFKACFWWAIQPEIISRIRDGGYGVLKDEAQPIPNGGDIPPTSDEMYYQIESLDECKLCKHFRHQVANKIGAPAYKSALGKTEIVDGRNYDRPGQLLIFVPPELVGEYLRSKYSGFQAALNECPTDLANKIVLYTDDRDGKLYPYQEIIRSANPTPHGVQTAATPQRTSFSEGNPYRRLN